MDRVFVSSKLRADTPEAFQANIEKAKTYCRYVLDRGYNPYAPHVFYTQFMDDNNPEHRDKALILCMEELSRSDQIWVFLRDDDKPSQGVQMEIEFALANGIRVRVYNDKDGVIERHSHPDYLYHITG